MPHSIRASPIDPVCKLHTDGEPYESFTYDANGNTETMLAAGITITYTWDMDDKLVGISGSDVATYIYDFNGNRLRRILNGATWDYLYSKEDILKVEQGSINAMYLTQGPAVDDVLSETIGSTTNFAYKSMLNSVSQLTNSTDMISNYNYDAWGQAVSWPSQAADANPYAFTGREWDLVGCYFYRNRFYQPEIGRMESRDRIRISLQPSLMQIYTYSSNSPVQFYDPFGFDTWIAIPGTTSHIKNGCTKAQEKAIMAAALKAQQAVNQCLPACFRDKQGPIYGVASPAKVWKIGLSISCTNDDLPESKDMCGYNYPNTTAIVIYNDAFDDPVGCGCLPATIFHESMHAGGWPHPTPYDCENLCFPQCHPNPNGDKCRCHCN